jgi:hypothetical protein
MTAIIERMEERGHDVLNRITFKQRLTAVLVVIVFAVSAVEFTLFRAAMLANLAKNDPSALTIVRELGWSGAAVIAVSLLAVFIADAAITRAAKAIETEFE